MCNVRIIERFEKNEIFLPPSLSSFYPGNGAGKFSSLLDHNIFFPSIHFDFEIFTFCGEMGILQANCDVSLEYAKNSYFDDLWSVVRLNGSNSRPPHQKVSLSNSLKFI